MTRTSGLVRSRLVQQLLQSHAPIRAINAYLDGFHFYNGHMDDQMEADHYCAILSEDFTQ